MAENMTTVLVPQYDAVGGVHVIHVVTIHAEARYLDIKLW